MSLLPLQSRVVETMRLRLGHRPDGKTIKKLADWRVTSSDPTILSLIADLYGGKVEPWPKNQGAPSEGQFQVLTTSRVIEVAVNPDLFPPINQAFELWSAGGCQRRCDGTTDSVSGQDCLCRAEGQDPLVPESTPKCKPHSRLSVWLWKTGRLGLARLDSTGFAAAMEIPTSIALLPEIPGHEGWRRGILYIDHRRSTKNGETRQFVVPVLEADTAAGDHLLGAGTAPAAARITAGAERPALPAGAGPVVEGPVEPRPAPSVAPGPTAAERRRRRLNPDDLAPTPDPPGQTTIEGDAA